MTATDIGVIAPVFKMVWLLSCPPQTGHFPVELCSGFLGPPALTTALHTQWFPSFPKGIFKCVTLALATEEDTAKEQFDEAENQQESSK